MANHDPHPSTPSPTPTRELLQRFARGDRGAFDQLFEATVGELEVYLRLRTGEALGAQLNLDDLVQETFAAALEGLDSFEYRGERSFLHWLCAIGENRLRRVAERGRAIKRKGPGSVLRASRVTDRAPDPRTGPVTAAARAESREALEAALAALVEEEREVLLARFFRGATLGAIAAERQTSESAARRLLGRALARVGRALRDHGVSGA